MVSDGLLQLKLIIWRRLEFFDQVGYWGRWGGFIGRVIFFMGVGRIGFCQCFWFFKLSFFRFIEFLRVDLFKQFLWVFRFWDGKILRVCWKFSFFEFYWFCLFCFVYIRVFGCGFLGCFFFMRFVLGFFYFFICYGVLFWEFQLFFLVIQRV